MLNPLAVWLTCMTAALGLLTGCQSLEGSNQETSTNMSIHYTEFVCPDVEAQRASLEQVLGVTFGPPVAELGQARVAETPEGSLIGVRAPLAAHEQPIVRNYFSVGDIHQAVQKAESMGAMIAYPPTEQGDTGTWAIYILDGVQVGLWQR